MTINALRKTLRAQPFMPFEIHLAGGRTLPVEHPGFVAFDPPGRVISVGAQDGGFEIVDLLLVTSLKPRSNGSRARRRPER